MEHFKRKYQKKQLFQLFIISLGNFPESIKIDSLLDQFWKLSKGKIINRRLELINYNDLIN